MNIRFNPAILMWTTGVQGFDTLPYDEIGMKKSRLIFFVNEQIENGPLQKLYWMSWAATAILVIDQYRSPS